MEGRWLRVDSGNGEEPGAWGTPRPVADQEGSGTPGGGHRECNKEMPSGCAGRMDNGGEAVLGCAVEWGDVDRGQAPIPDSVTLSLLPL